MGCTPSSQRPECHSPNFQFSNSPHQLSPLVLQYQLQRQRRNSKQNLNDESQYNDESFLPIDSIEAH